MKYTILLNKLIILFLYNFANCVPATKLIESSSVKKPPDLYLGAYLEADTIQLKAPDQRFRFQNQFQNDFISKNGTDFVVSEEISQIIFICEAKYPIVWLFPFTQQLTFAVLGGLISSEYRTSTFSADLREPQNVRFKLLLSIKLELLQFFSTNLSCKSAEILPELQSSVHIYLNGNRDLENQGKTLNIPHVLKSDQPNSLTLPCRPSSPNLEILLEMQSQTGKHQWTSITNWHFNPKFGFTLLDSNKFGNSFYTLFRCSVASNDIAKTVSNFVYFNITPPTVVTTDLQKNFRSQSVLRGKASVQFETISQGQNSPITHLKCCSDVPKKPPVVYVQHCSSAFECNLRKTVEFSKILEQILFNFKNAVFQPKLAVPNDCTFYPVLYSSEVVVCKGNNVVFMEHYNNIFNALSEGSIVNRSISSKPITKKFSKTDPDYVPITEFSPVSKPVPVSRKMKIFAARHFNETFIFQSHTTFVGPPIVFPSHETKPLENLNLENFFSTLENPQEQLRRYSIEIVEYDRNVYYNGESLMFLCVGAKIFYAKGAHLILNWKNGTQTILEVGNDNHVKIPGNKLLKMFYLAGDDSMFSGRAENTEYVFGKSIKAQENMSSVECWMPLEGSGKWDKVSKTVKVLPSAAPKFLEPEEETVYFYVDDKYKIINCTVIEALPLPTLIKVFKDGKKQPIIQTEAEKTENGTKSKNTVIQPTIGIKEEYKEVWHEHQGVIKCVVGNANKTVTRTVHVFIIHRPGLILPISLSIFGIASLIFVGLGLKRRYG